MLKEFKEFAVKGNMVDMAVGIIIGAAFGTVVKSVVDDLLMPLVASIVGAPDFSNLFVVLRAGEGVEEQSVAAIREAGGVVLAYGLFINAVIAFVIVALVLFMVVKAMNRLKRQEEEAPAEEPAPPEPTNEEVLLTEIRDLLRAQATS
jgi:large conductance mechanosensitive channel